MNIDPTIASDQLPFKKIDRYMIHTNKCLGRGNFSQVYTAVDQTTSQQVAVKIISIKKLNSEIARKLLSNEISVLKSLKHPNVLSCSNILSSPHNFYIFTEICPGGDLERLLSQKKKFTEQEISTIVIDVLQGLLYLNSQDVVHRDIKAANIFLDDKGRAKIADFGFAVKAKGVFKDINIGSPAYMSPEGLFEKTYSSKTDVWSFGLLLYELLHGDIPLTVCKTQQQLRECVVLSPKFDPSISADLKDLIKKCLKVDLNQRIDITEIPKAKYIRRITTLTVSRHSCPKSANQSVRSTTVSVQRKGLSFQPCDYSTAVAILHYCRLLHKTLAFIPSFVLMQWLLKVSESLQQTRFEHFNQSQLAKLHTIIESYFMKYRQVHGELVAETTFEQVTAEMKRLLKVNQEKPSLEILLNETRHLKACIGSQLSKFGQSSLSGNYLQKLGI